MKCGRGRIDCREEQASRRPASADLFSGARGLDLAGPLRDLEESSQGSLQHAHSRYRSDRTLRAVMDSFADRGWDARPSGPEVALEIEEKRIGGLVADA